LLDEGHGDGDIFEAVDDEIDFVIEEGLLELADKEAFAAQLVEGAVGDLVAGGFESGEVDLQSWVELLQGVYDEIRLGEGEGGAAGAEAEEVVV
jgi:hypothetical protein